MQKILISGLLLFVLNNLACENTGEMKNQDVVQTQPPVKISPTPKDNSDKRPSQEFIDQYQKGITICTTGKRPEDLPKAIEEFKKAAEIDPTDTTSFEWMIKIYMVLEDFQGVAESYRQIIKRNPKQLNAQYGLAYVLIENLKNYDEGLKEVLIAKEKDASYSWAIEELLGKAYEGKGDIPNAIKHYKAYLKYFRDTKNTDSTLYKNMQKKVAELEKATQNSNINK